MKSMIRWFVGFVTVFVLGLGAMGAYLDSNPKVPIKVALLGRQAVTQHLLSQVNMIQVQVSGESVMTPADWNLYYIGREALEKMGYTFNGSTVELFDVISRQYFTVDAKPINGHYDIGLDIEFFDQSGALLLSGSAYFEVMTADNGSLYANVEPWISIPSEIDIVADEILGHESHWTDLQYGGLSPTDCMVYSDGSMSIIRGFPINRLGTGYLTVTDRFGNVRVIDLVTGTIVPHSKVNLYLDQAHSSEVQIVDGVTGNWLSKTSFYQSDNVLYGRVPLLEVVGTGNSVTAEFSVRVWGTDRLVVPDSIILKSLSDGKMVRMFGDTVFRFFNLQLDAGVKYQIIVQFGDKFLDWDADPNPRG